MRDELLALLEDGAHSARQLANWLSLPKMRVSQELHAMRGDGLVHRQPNSGHWALGLEESKKEPPAAVPQGDRRTKRYRLARRDAAEDIDRRLGIQEPSSGPSVCLHCLRRFTPDRECQEYCTTSCREQGPAWAPGTRTIVVGGLEYEATSPGARR